MQITCNAMVESSDNNCPNSTIDDIMQEFQSLEVGEIVPSYENYQLDTDSCMAQIKNFELNYTTKQLALIYEYYGLGRTTKMKKLEVIQSIVFYECVPENIDMVERRILLWEYMCELKDDPLLKKYIIAP